MARNGIATSRLQEFPIVRPSCKLSSKLISPDDVDRLKAVAETFDQLGYMVDVIELTYVFALRLGEACAAKVEWVDPKGLWFVVRNDSTFSTKTGLENAKPMNQEQATWLEERCRGRRKEEYLLRNSKGSSLTRKHTSKMFKKLARAAGMDEAVTFHSLRHSRLSALVQSGVSVEATRLFAGHSTIDMTMRYVHLSPEWYRQAVIQAVRT